MSVASIHVIAAKMQIASLKITFQLVNVNQALPAILSLAASKWVAKEIQSVLTIRFATTGNV
jgi:hypothetical protein